MSLSDLRTLQTSAVIRARLAAALAADGQPVAQWTPSAYGGIENAVLDAASTALAKIVAPKLVQQVEMRFLDLSVGDALTIYAQKRYKTARNPATYTIQNVKLSSGPGAPTYTFGPGDLWMRGAGGNLYQSIDAVTVPTNAAGRGGIDCRFQAQNPGSAYSDVAGTITQMVTAPAGVTGVNVRPALFAPTSVTGTSSGTIVATPLGGTGPIEPTIRSIRVRIESQGQIGTATFSYSIDEGVTWTAGGPVPANLVIPNQAFLTFSNGGNPSFVAGDIFTLLVADSILQRGADEESDASLRRRCRLRWATLSDVPTEGLVTLWAYLASPEVVRVRVDADANTPGGMLVQLAAQGGPASPAAVIAVQDYITPRLRGYKDIPGPPAANGNLPTETVLASSARAYQVSVASSPQGVVTVSRAQLTAVQQKADANWDAYLAGLPIGGLIVFAELYQAIMDAGAGDVTGIQMNGGAADIQLASDQVAVIASGETLTNALAWKAI